MNTNRRKFLKSNAMLAMLAGLGSPVFGLGRSKKSSSTFNNSVMQSKISQYQACLGGPFPEPDPLMLEIHGSSQKDGYQLKSISYMVREGERVGAYLLVPDGVNGGNPAPGIGVWHQHNGEYHLGKSEPAGLAGNPMHHTAVGLVKEGYVVLCPDALCFEDRQDPKGILKDGDYERFEFLREVVRGRSLAWRNIWDMKRAIDLLCDRPEVISDRIGCYGHSMGSTHSWLAGPLEKRLKCIIGNCCLPTYEAIEQEHLLHCFPNFVPGWKIHGDTPEIAALIAPRPLHLNFGGMDGGSPIESVKRGLKRIADVYEEAGNPDNFTYYIEEDAAHVLTDTMWQHVKDCFGRHLKSG